MQKRFCILILQAIKNWTVGRPGNEGRTKYLLIFEAGSIRLQILSSVMWTPSFLQDGSNGRYDSDCFCFFHRLQSDMAARIAELEEELRRYVGGTGSLVSFPDPTPSHEEKQSGELSQISWACRRFCDSVA